MTESVHVVLRASADATTGTGHLMRALTLGRELRDRGVSVTIVTNPLSEELQSLVDRTQLATRVVPAIEDVEHVDVLCALRPTMVILDGYALGPVAHELTARGVRVGVIDDHNITNVRQVDLIVDPNPGAITATYAGRAGKVLAGAPYALVRPNLPQDRAELSPDDLILVAMGGADPRNLTQPIAEALAALGSQVVVAAGAANPNRAALISWATSTAEVSIADRDLVDAYRNARLAIIGAGTMLWECAAIGLPTVALVVADNQVSGAAVARAAGCSRTFDARTSLDPLAIATMVGALASDLGTLQHMGAAGRSLVDWMGATRVAQAVLAAAHRPPQSLSDAIR